MRAYLKWFEDSPELSLFRLIGLFDRPVALEELKAIVSLKKIEGLTTELDELTPSQWSYAVGRLSDAKLISVDRRRNRCFIDCHPLVRDFIGDHLRTDFNSVWRQGHGLIFDFLLSSVPAEPANMTEMEPLFRAVIHGTRAGRYDESFQLYFERIKKKYVMLTEGCHHADQACIRSFFSKEWDQPVEELPEEAKFHLLTSVAANLMSLGNIDEAIQPSRRSMDWFIDHERWLEATGIAGPFVSMLIATGNLEDALSLIEEQNECVRNTNNPVISAMALNFKAYCFHLSGKSEEAGSYFEEVDKVVTQYDPGLPIMFPTVSSYYCKFLLDTGAHQQALERSLKTFGWRERKSWQVLVDTTSLLASDLMVLGLISLRMGDLINAKIHLDKQLELLKSADEWLYLPTGLNSRALFYIRTKNFEAAAEDLEEALSISKRTGAKFGEWETYLNLSQLYFKQEDFRTSKSYLDKAKGMPGMAVYRFRDAEIDELEKNLSAVRASDRPSEGVNKGDTQP